jgi:hypothetical protein
MLLMKPHSFRVQMHFHRVRRMMRNKTTWALVALSCSMLITFFAVQTRNAGASEQCISDWAKAAAIVKQRRMIDVDSLSVLARKKFNGQIMTARLCKDDDSYFYRLVIRHSDGRVERVKVDALNPTK